MSLNNSICALFLILSVFYCHVKADTPANCTFEDVQGSWIFYETDRGQDKTTNCSSFCKFIGVSFQFVVFIVAI